jgi:predicted GIY-YIG superfamily endonuclease
MLAEQIIRVKKDLGIWVYIEEFENKTDALKRELFLKHQKNKEFYQRLINSMDR